MKIKKKNFIICALVALTFQWVFATNALAASGGAACGIRFSMKQAKLYVNQTLKLNPSLTIYKKHNHMMRYVSSNSKIAKVDVKGTVTAVSAGKAIISAITDSGKAAVTILVMEPSVKSITITLPSEMKIDETTVKASVDVTMEPSNAKTPAISFSSDDESIAAVDDFGGIKANGVGTATITAKAGTSSTSAKIIVKPVVSSVSASVKSNPINGKFLAIYTKTKIATKVDTVPATASIKPEFKSSDESIATVDADGNVLGRKPGAVTISIAAGGKTSDLPMVIYDSCTDTDKDGLPDYEEIHKYLSDPEKFSTNGDGVSDGDWNRRREFTYSIRSVMELSLVQPIEDLNSIYQDARILGTDSRNVSTVEVISYPYGVVAYKTETLVGNPDWQKQNAENQVMQKYLAPGITTNWDAQLRTDLLNDLKQQGIEPDKLTDVELVKKVIDLNLNAKFTFIDAGWVPPFQLVNIMQEKDGKLYFDPKYNDGIQNLINKVNDRYKTSFDLQGLLEHNVYGKQMYYNKVHGNCNSIVTLSATIFKALGIPSRIVVIDSPVEVGQNMETHVENQSFGYPYVNNNSQNAGIFGGGHTYTELYVGGKWMKADNLLNFPTGEDTNMIANIKPGFKFVEVVFQNILDNTKIGTYEQDQHHWPDFRSVSDKIGSQTGSRIWQKLNDYSTKYSISHMMSADDNVFKLLSEKMQLQSIGGTNLSADELQQKNMLAIFQDGSLGIAPQLQPWFQGMDKGDKNFLNVKIVNGKLLVLLKAESREKLEYFVEQLDASDLYTEQYVNYDK